MAWREWKVSYWILECEYEYDVINPIKKHWTAWILKIQTEIFSSLKSGVGIKAYKLSMSVRYIYFRLSRVCLYIFKIWYMIAINPISTWYNNTISKTLPKQIDLYIYQKSNNENTSNIIHILFLCTRYISTLLPFQWLRLQLNIRTSPIHKIIWKITSIIMWRLKRPHLHSICID